jgi:endonuclease III
MSASNRSALINKTYKVLKNYYAPVTPPADRSVLDHLLYACCLQNASPEAADEAFAKLQQAFFDWNEVRVTTVIELAETMSALPDAAEAATRLKRSLQHIFETHYSYDIEELKKQNLGKAAKELESIRGTTPFTVAYVTQHGLGGHSIPVASGVVQSLKVIGIISEAEAKKKRVPGLERAIPKTKGIEFASLLHQLGAEFYVSRNSSKIRSIILAFNPEAKERLPKRASKAEDSTETGKSAKPKTASKSTGKSAAKTAPKAGTKSAGEKKGTGATAASTPKKRTKKSATSGDVAKKKTTKSKKSTKGARSTKRSPTKQLTRKKPR